MKLIFKIFIYPIIFIFLVLFFLPKEELYYFFEKSIEEKNLIISDETINEKIVGIELLSSKIYYDKLYIADIEKIEFISLLFTNNLSINNIKISDEFKSFLSTNIENVEINYSILNYDKIDIELKNESFFINGYFYILENRVKLELVFNKDKSINNSQNILRYFKNIDGRYYYEYQL